MGDREEIAINPIIYAEIAADQPSKEALDAMLDAASFVRLPLPYDVGFLAGRAFLDYRRRGGARRSPLPDFYIGAHAAVLGLKLLTRDPAVYRSYFPGVGVIAP